MAVYLVDLSDLIKKVLFVNDVAALIELGEPLLDEASHLEYAKHLFLFVKKGEVVRQELDLEGKRELLDHLKVKQVQQLRQEPMLGLIDVDLENGALSLFLGDLLLNCVDFFLIWVGAGPVCVKVF